MVRNLQKPRVWRPRFSMKTLFVAITVTATLLASWELTKRHAGWKRTTELVDAYAMAPFVVYMVEPTEGRVRY